MTSKADQLGAGRFGAAVRTVSARRQAVAAATGVPTEGVADPTELPVHRISLNPDNPRSSLGDLTDLAGSLKTHGQKQAITVMNRDAYIKANPSQEAELEAETTHVVVDGSSRLAAAREAGLATIKVMVSDDQGATSEELLESALVANIHRQDLEEIDEARALQRLLAIHGSQRALAKRLHRSQGWVSQRLALLNLTPELQSRIGEEPIDLLRAVGNKPADQQEAALEELKRERARKEEDRGRTAKARHEKTTQGGTESTTVGPAGDYAVITQAPDSTTHDQPTSDRSPAGDYVVISGERDTKASSAPKEAPTDAGQAAPTSTASADERPATAVGSATPSVPVQPSGTDAKAEAGSRQLKKFPYDDGAEAAYFLIHRMPPEEFDKMLALLVKHKNSQAIDAG
ncbi:ParB/RepB/Spo0J family partition protein [Streptomyces sp. NPDC049915]|uniref:ParB/RepB/Spo0J family partition protein n=1 Tax=Streptomyces sp. NPDC049915 TaxID=3155510 RepID=UPI0034405465